ncbi:hypothetical protein [Gilliamella sp. wkB112]|nr:hypothetical protein [Gilliamella apicola]
MPLDIFTLNNPNAVEPYSLVKPLLKVKYGNAPWIFYGRRR